MSQFSSSPEIFGAALDANDAAPKMNVGAIARTPNGNTYRYVYNGGVALAAGTLLQAPVENTAHQDRTAPVAAIGATSIAFTLGASAAAANEYAGGWLVVTVTPGVGQMYEIDSHASVLSNGTITLKLKDPLRVAITATSRLDLVHNPYNGVIINPASATSTPVGVSICVIDINCYGWIQTGGIATVLADGSVTVGTSLVASNATPGAVEALTGVQAAVGLAMSGIATTEYGPIRLTIE